MTGRFVSLEGGEGVGKSTQARALATALGARGIDAVVTREPGGSAGAEEIRRLLFEDESGGGGGGERWSPAAEALLFAAARADHVERVIRPALAAGRWVVCDRFIDSSRAYQGDARDVGDAAVMTLHQIGSAGLLPDRTLLLALPAGEAEAREAARDGAPDRFRRRGADYHARVRRRFEAIAAAEPARVRTIDARGDVAAVAARVIEALGDLLP